jgi:hypothetical protein
MGKVQTVGHVARSRSKEKPMIERLTLNRHERNIEAVAIKADTPMSLVRKLHDCLCKLLAHGDANRDNFHCAIRWNEVECALEALVPVRHRLPRRLFWHVYLPLKDSRCRLEANPVDCHAVNQLRYIEKVLSNAVYQQESV